MIDDRSGILQRVSDTLAERREADPNSSYVASLYAKGLDAILKKVAEESAEVLMAAKDGDRLHIVWEVTDLWFHSLILMAHFGLSADDILVELRRREGISGIDEKRARMADAVESTPSGE